jgi:hypothetical protein
MKKSYVVETVSTFKMKYVVQTDKEIKQTELQRLIDEGRVPELDQVFLGERITGVYENEDFSFLNEQLVLDLDKPVPEELIMDEP